MPAPAASKMNALATGTPASKISIADVLRNVNDPKGKVVKEQSPDLYRAQPQVVGSLDQRTLRLVILYTQKTEIATNFPALSQTWNHFRGLPCLWPALLHSCVRLDICVLELYAHINCSTCGFGKRALLSDSPFRSLCCSSFFFVSPRQPDKKTSPRTNMPLVGKPQRACSCVMLVCEAYHMKG